MEFATKCESMLQQVKEQIVFVTNSQVNFHFKNKEYLTFICGPKQMKLKVKEIRDCNVKWAPAAVVSTPINVNVKVKGRPQSSGMPE